MNKFSVEKEELAREAREELIRISMSPELQLENTTWGLNEEAKSNRKMLGHKSQESKFNMLVRKTRNQ